VAVVLYFWLKYKYPDGKFALVHKTILLGMAGILPVFVLDKMIVSLHLDSLHSLNRTMFYAFVLTGGAFEFWKFLVLRLFVYPSKRVEKPLDVILYSIFIAAGFTTAYSIYVLFYVPAYVSVCTYALTIGPVFVLISVIMGYFTGISIRRDHPKIDMMVGLFLAVLFHGLYRFCLLTSDSLLLYMSLGGLLVIGITLLSISLRQSADDSN
jgi:RsiW-degrading membrane proteinase PrsW (M82 family)